MVVLLYRSRVPLLLLMILLMILLLLLLLLGSLFLFRLYYRSHIRPQIDLVWILHLEVLRKALWIHVAPRFQVPVVILSGVAAAGIVEGPPPDLCRGQCLVPIRQVSDFLGGEIGQGGGRSDKTDAPHQPVFGGLGSVVSDGFQTFLFPPELLGGLLRKGRRRRRRRPDRQIVHQSLWLERRRKRNRKRNRPRREFSPQCVPDPLSPLGGRCQSERTDGSGALELRVDRPRGTLGSSLSPKASPRQLPVSRAPVEFSDERQTGTPDRAPGGFQRNRAPRAVSGMDDQRGDAAEPDRAGAGAPPPATLSARVSGTLWGERPVPVRPRQPVGARLGSPHRTIRGGPPGALAKVPERDDPGI
mmetsp:Transcript_24699/g.58416  ORF Transcript_24699/g.58416 Transcript_24699/m.58416 type:complete len:359 (+) Transcript_24699:268-1344(+)